MVSGAGGSVMFPPWPPLGCSLVLECALPSSLSFLPLSRNFSDKCTDSVCRPLKSCQGSCGCWSPLESSRRTLRSISAEAGEQKVGGAQRQYFHPPPPILTVPGQRHGPFVPALTIAGHTVAAFSTHTDLVLFSFISPLMVTPSLPPPLSSIPVPCPQTSWGPCALSGHREVLSLQQMGRYWTPREVVTVWLSFCSCCPGPRPWCMSCSQTLIMLVTHSAACVISREPEEAPAPGCGLQR